MLLQVITLLLLVIVPAVCAQSCERTYAVQSGDTCNSICADQDVSTFQLNHDNPNINAACSNLFVGATLCLGVQGMDCNVVHVIGPGDTCGAIASESHTSLNTLLANNPNVNSDCTNIVVGEVLCTAADIIPYT